MGNHNFRFRLYHMGTHGKIYNMQESQSSCSYKYITSESSKKIPEMGILRNLVRVGAYVFTIT